MATQTLSDRQAVLPPGLAPLLTKRQLQAYYGVSAWSVEEWMRRGLPVEPTTLRGPRFDLDKVRAWMTENNSRAA